LGNQLQIAQIHDKAKDLTGDEHRFLSADGLRA
jgi:hypothetical protein